MKIAVFACVVPAAPGRYKHWDALNVKSPDRRIMGRWSLTPCTGRGRPVPRKRNCLTYPGK